MEVLQGHPRLFLRFPGDVRSGLNSHGLTVIRESTLVDIGHRRIVAGTVWAQVTSDPFLHRKRLSMSTRDFLVPANVDKS